MRPRTPNPSSPARNDGRKSGLQRIIVPLAIGAMILVVLTQEVPQVQEWMEAMVRPEQSRARKACHTQALAAATHPDFARLLDRGNVHRTQNGYYIEAIVVGEMNADGKETLYRFSCYADPGGRVVNTHRETTIAEPGREWRPHEEEGKVGPRP